MADSTYFPVLSGVEAVRKRLVLTTVNENQDAVQIDIYRSEDQEFSSPEYVGSLLLESVPKSPAGELDIEVIIGVDDTGQLDAQATELSSQSQQTLSVSLQGLSDRSVYSVPDFEPEISSVSEIMSYEDEFSEEEASSETPVSPRKGRLFWGVLFIIVSLGLIGLIALLLSRLLGGEAVPPLAARMAAFSFGIL